MTIQLLWVVVSYLFGALPFSVWIGRLAGKNIEEYGDHNPGATNVLRAAGIPWFIWAMCADIGKGALVVGLAYQVWGWRDWTMLPIALAPSVGHVFSPFLGWRGGKAIATTFGVWIGLTIWDVPLVAIVLLVICFLLVQPEGWAIMLTLVGMLGYLFIGRPNGLFITILISQLALMSYTHRKDLIQRPQFRPRASKAGTEA